MNIICNSSKLEMIHMSLNSRMDKQIVVYSWNAVLQSNTSQWTLALLIKDNSHRYNFEQKKLDTRIYGLLFHLHKVQNR